MAIPTNGSFESPLVVSSVTYPGLAANWNVFYEHTAFDLALFTGDVAAERFAIGWDNVPYVFTRAFEAGEIGVFTTLSSSTKLVDDFEELWDGNQIYHYTLETPDLMLYRTEKSASYSFISSSLPIPDNTPEGVSQELYVPLDPEIAAAGEVWLRVKVTNVAGHNIRITVYPPTSLSPPIVLGNVFDAPSYWAFWVELEVNLTSLVEGYSLDGTWRLVVEDIQAVGQGMLTVAALDFYPARQPYDSFDLGWDVLTYRTTFDPSELTTPFVEDFSTWAEGTFRTSLLEEERTIAIFRYEHTNLIVEIFEAVYPARAFTFAVDTGVFYVEGHGLLDGAAIMFVRGPSGNLPSGLNDASIYYVRDKTNDTFRISLAPSGTAFLPLSQGAGTNYIKRDPAGYWD